MPAKIKRYVWVLILVFLVISCTQLRRINKVPPYAISLVPSVTEIIYAMEAERHLLAVSEQCDYPPQTKSLLKVGSMLNPSKELILKLDPDVVFVTLPMQAEVKRELESLGIKCVNVTPKTTMEIIESVVKIGKLLREEEKARLLADSLKKELFHLTSQISPDKSEIKVYVEIQNNPIITVGGNSFINNYILIAGGENIFQNIHIGYPSVDPEEVIKRKPDIIILTNSNKSEVYNRIGWQNVPAVKHGCIFDSTDIDIDALVRPGPRFVKAIKELRKLILTCEDRIAEGDTEKAKGLSNATAIKR